MQNDVAHGVLVEDMKGYRAVVQALSDELKEAQRDRNIQCAVIQEMEGHIQIINEKQKELGVEARKGWNEEREMGETERAKKGTRRMRDVT